MPFYRVAANTYAIQLLGYGSPGNIQNTVGSAGAMGRFDNPHTLEIPYARVISVPIPEPADFPDTLPEAPPSADAEAATAVWDAPSATVTPGAVSVAAAAATAVWEAPAATVSPGAVTAAATAATAVWSAPDAAVSPGAVSAQAVDAVAVWSAPAATVSPGAVSAPAVAATGVWSAPAATASPGAVSVPAVASTAVWSAPAATAVTVLAANAVAATAVWDAPAATATVPGPPPPPPPPVTPPALTGGGTGGGAGPSKGYFFEREPPGWGYSESKYAPDVVEFAGIDPNEPRHELRGKRKRSEDILVLIDDADTPWFKKILNLLSPKR